MDSSHASSLSVCIAVLANNKLVLGEAKLICNGIPMEPPRRTYGPEQKNPFRCLGPS